MVPRKSGNSKRKWKFSISCFFFSLFLCLQDWGFVLRNRFVFQKFLFLLLFGSSRLRFCLKKQVFFWKVSFFPSFRVFKTFEHQKVVPRNVLDEKFLFSFFLGLQDFWTPGSGFVEETEKSTEVLDQEISFFKLFSIFGKKTSFFLEVYFSFEKPVFFF